MFLDRFKKPKIVKIVDLGRVDNPLLDVGSLDIITDNCKTVYESAKAFYGEDDDGFLLRFKKKSWHPTIRKVETVSYNPTADMVTTDKKTLLQIAGDYELEVYETESAFLVLTHGLTIMAGKPEKVK